MEYYTFNKTQRIVHILLMKSKFVTSPGLLYGQMGIALSFAHWYRVTFIEAYEDSMSYLLDTLMEHVYNETTIEFGSGLSGIGWGIEYLVQNKFVDGISSEICKEIDEKIMKMDPRRMLDVSLETGMEGLLHYVLAHILGVFKQQGNSPFDERYLEDLYFAIKQPMYKNSCPPLRILIDQYIYYYLNRKLPSYELNPCLFVTNIDINNDLLKQPLGLRNGLAGILLINI